MERPQVGSLSLMGEPKGAARGRGPRTLGPIGAELVTFDPGPDGVVGLYAGSTRKKALRSHRLRSGDRPLVEGEAVGRVVLGRYRIVRQVAKGGMGVIYLARHEGAAGFVRPVIVKQILSTRDQEVGALRMFVREAKITSQLRHPNIVSILDFREEHGAHYMVLDYVHGRHVGMWRKFMKRMGRKMEVEIAVHIALSVLDALHHAHTLVGPDGTPIPIIHRDVTPSNILVDVTGQVKLTDFGIARIETETAEFKTETPTIKGKFPYLAPELLKNAIPTISTDLYSVGVSLHELLVGRNEFRSKDIASTVARVLNHEPSPIETIRPDAPRGLGDVVRRALARDPDARFASAQDFAAALREACPGISETRVAKLRELAAHDFFDPAMIDLSGVDLGDLDRAWREEPAQVQEVDRPVPMPGPEPLLENEGPTRTDRRITGAVGIAGAVGLDGSMTGSRMVDSTRLAPSAIPSLFGLAPPPDTSSRWKTARGVLFAVMLLAVGGAVTWWLLRLEMSTESQATAVVVERGEVTRGQPSVAAVGPRSDGLPPANAESANADPTNAESTNAESTNAESTNAESTNAESTNAESTNADPTNAERAKDARRSSVRPSATTNPAAALTRAFARRRGLVERCFAEHVGGATPKADDVEVRFKVGLDGDVVSAEVLPETLSATPLAGCIVGVARGTQFGPQKQVLSFRIPIRVRRGG